MLLHVADSWLASLENGRKFANPSYTLLVITRIGRMLHLGASQSWSSLVARKKIGEWDCCSLVSSC